MASGHIRNCSTKQITGNSLLSSEKILIVNISKLLSGFIKKISFWMYKTALTRTTREYCAVYLGS